MKIKKLPAAVKALKDFPATGIFNSHCLTILGNGTS